MKRSALERGLRDAEVALQEASFRAVAAHDAVDGYTAKFPNDRTVAEMSEDAKLSRLVATEETATSAVAEATKKRDDLLKALVKQPLGGFVNGHGEAIEPRGVVAGFGPDDLGQARAHLLGSNPTPIRLGPPKIVDPHQPQAGIDRGGFMAATGSADFVEAAVSQYDLSYLFPYLRERPSVAQLFPARAIDLYSLSVFKINTPANQAAPVLEGGTKPTSTPQTERVEIVPQVVAHLGSFTRQAMYDYPEFLDQFASEFLAGLLLAVDVQLLSGDQSAPNLNGILHESGTGSYVRDSTNETRVDAILSGITNVRTNAFADPTSIIISPNTLEAVRKEKADTSGLYTVAPVAPLDEQGLPHSLWGMSVVATTSIEDGTAVVINPDLYGQLVYRMPAIIEINPFEGWATNELGLRAEWWGNLGCVHPQAACIVTDL